MNFGWGEEEKEDGEMEIVHHPDEVWVRYDLKRDKPWKKVKIVKPRRHCGEKETLPRKLYDGKLPIKKGKKRDLEKIASEFVPHDHHRFYFQLRASALGDSSDEESDNNM